MSLEINNFWNKWKKNNSVNASVASPKEQIDWILNYDKNQIISILKEVEKKEKWFQYNQETLDALFGKYPNLTLEQFKWYFLAWTYNKNILYVLQK